MAKIGLFAMIIRSFFVNLIKARKQNGSVQVSALSKSTSVNWRFKLLALATLWLVYSSASRVMAQSEQTRTASKAISLADLAPLEWNSGLYAANIVTSGDRIYILLLPRSSQDSQAALLVLSDKGSLIAIKHLSPKSSHVLGIDASGNVTVLRREDRNSGAIEKYSSNGVLTGKVAVGSSPATLRGAELGMMFFRDPSTPAPTIGAIRSISQKRTANHQEYVDFSLEDNRTARFNLSQPRVTMSDAEGNIIGDREIGRSDLDRYSSVRRQTDPNVSYPELYSPVISPEGQFFAIVSNTKLADGAVVARIDLQAATIDSIFRLVLPTRVEAKNPENLDGYLVPGALAVGKDTLFLLDKGFGILLAYDR